MVARLLMCIIVSCPVDRKIADGLYGNQASRLLTYKKPTSGFKLTTVPLVSFFATIRRDKYERNRYLPMKHSRYILTSEHCSLIPEAETETHGRRNQGSTVYLQHSR